MKDEMERNEPFQELRQQTRQRFLSPLLLKNFRLLPDDKSRKVVANVYRTVEELLGENNDDFRRKMAEAGEPELGVLMRSGSGFFESLLKPANRYLYRFIFNAPRPVRIRSGPWLVHRGLLGSGKGNQSQLWSHIANMPPPGSRGMPDQDGLVTIDRPFPANPR